MHRLRPDRLAAAGRGKAFLMREPVPVALRGALIDALAVLLPTACASCGTADRAVCERCAAQLVPAPMLHRLDRGGESLPVWSALDYSGVARVLIGALKEKNRTDVAGALAVPLASALRAACAAVGGTRETGLELLTFPPSRASSRSRGYDPVPLLLSRVPGAPRPATALRMVRQPRDQAGLGVDDRQANVAGSLRATGILSGRRFLLVDDVVTTGSTLWEARRAILAAGGGVAGAATLAHTARRHPAVSTAARPAQIHS